MLVVNLSGIGMKSTLSDVGSSIVTPPSIRVAIQMRPRESMAKESKRKYPLRPFMRRPPSGLSFALCASCPGEDSGKAQR